MAVVGTHTQKEVDPEKKTFFVIEKHVRDIKQDQKVIPDPLGAIMKPTDPAKDELQRILSNLNQSRPKIQEFRVSIFWMSRNSTDSRRKPTANTACEPNKF